jgi:hypothetical protein
MANGKRNRKSRQRREPLPAGIPSCALWFMHQVLPLLRRHKVPRRRSAQHLRRATIEMLEAMRALLDETIEWLKHEDKTSPDLKRIRVEG